MHISGIVYVCVCVCVCVCVLKLNAIQRPEKAMRLFYLKSMMIDGCSPTSIC